MYYKNLNAHYPIMFTITHKWRNEKYMQHSICFRIFIFTRTATTHAVQTDIWVILWQLLGYSKIASWCVFPPYWRPWGDFVDRRFLGRGFGINQIYFFFSMNLRNVHNTQEAKEWWAFLYEILIIFFFHSQIFP